MIRALGYSVDTFDPSEPGRLCRGRERWIDPWENAPGEPATPHVHRLVVTGATFSDDSAADARRGTAYGGVDLATLIATLFPRRTLLAFMEDGHPADIPEDAQGVEAYEGHRAGGLVREVSVRWYKRVSGLREIREVLGIVKDAPLVDETGPERADRVRGFVVLPNDTPDDIDTLLDDVFLLCGMSTLDSPPARFQPRALSEILARAPAVLLLHRDKHGPALGIYGPEAEKSIEKLQAITAKEGLLLVPFAIPPMLARWDRALAELRQEWVAAGRADFPVPEAPANAAGWLPRRRRRRGRGDDASDAASLDESGAAFEDGLPLDVEPLVEDDTPVEDEVALDDKSVGEE